MLRISYAITAWNEHQELERLLDMLHSNIRPEDEIVLQLDNNATDEVKKVAGKYNVGAPYEYHRIFFGLNNDFATFKNNLSKHCTREYIFQIDADEYPHPHLLASLPDVLEFNNSIGVFLTPRINTVEGLTDKATKARLIAEKLTQQQEIIKSQIDLRKAQATQLTAKAEGPTGSQALQKYRELRALGMSDVDARNAAYGIRPEKEEGVKTGFDKLGRFTNQFGEVIPASEMSANRQGFEEGEKLLRSLNQITATDVKNAEGFDYTSSEVMKQTGGRLFGKTLEAQTRIAAAQLIKQIESLPKGSASDADMRAAKASFPGYGNAQALASWVNEAKATLEYSLERQAERYGQTRKVKTTAPLDLKQPSKRETKEQPAGQPKATKRYNMQTGQLEDIQ